MNSFTFTRQKKFRQLKIAIRHRVPLRYWSLVAGLVRTISHSLTETIATITMLFFRILPDGASIALREKLALHRYLDYDRAIITLRITSRIEQEIRLRSCQKEPETVEWIHQTIKPGDVLYDIGANVGAYSLIAASWTGGQATVYAFEPGYRTFPNLVDNIFINKLEQAVTPFQVALGDQTSIVEFSYTTIDAGGARHAGLRTGTGSAPPACRQAVMSYQLDEFVRTFGLRLPTHIKIDVDGSEAEVLRGAQQVLASTCLQWILVEVDETESDLPLVEALLKEYGFYREFDHYHAGSTVHNWIFRRLASDTHNAV